MAKNTLKSIFGTLCGVYATMVICSVFLLMSIVYSLSNLVVGKRGLRFLLRFNAQFISKLLFVLLPVRLKIHGKQHIKNTPYVVVSNHQSTLDIIINYVAFPYLLRFLSKKENSQFPILGVVVRTAALTVDRNSKQSRMKSYKDMIRTITKDRMSLLIYPEGTRNKSNKLLEKFYEGAFLVAIKTGTPILVQTIVGSGKLYPATKAVYLQPGVVHAYWDKPIETKGLTKADVPKLIEKVQQIMIGHLLENQEDKELSFHI